MEYTYVKGRHQPIVSEEEFQRVQDILNEKRGSMKSLQHNQKKPRGHSVIVIYDICAAICISLSFGADCLSVSVEKN